MSWPVCWRSKKASSSDCIDAYSLALAALVLTAGSLADRLGRRRLFAAGLGIFTVASLLCALAPDPTFLNVARAVQGVGGAVMFAVSLALIAQEFTAGRERGTAMGLYGAPIGVAAIAITYLKVRESRDPNATRVDWPGVATFSGALLLLVLALVRGNDEGWGSTLIVSLFAGSAALLVSFLAIERRVAEPMLPLGLFRRRAFTGVQLAAFAVSGSLFALFLYLTLYLQNYLGLSPFEAGVRYLPITVASFIFSPVAGMLLSRVHARAMLGTGMAAGINDTFRQVGVAVGIAVWGAIFVGRGADKVAELTAGTPAASGDRPRELVEAASSGNLHDALAAVPPDARPGI